MTVRVPVYEIGHRDDALNSVLLVHNWNAPVHHVMLAFYSRGVRSSYGSPSCLGVVS